MRFCGNCGNQLDDGDKWCSNCGKKVEESAGKPAEPVKIEIPKQEPVKTEPPKMVPVAAPAPTAPPVIEAAPVEKKQRKPRKKLGGVRKFFMILLSIAMVLALASTMLILAVRAVANKNSIETLIAQTNIADISAKYVDRYTVDQKLYEYIFDEGGKDMSIDEKSLKKLLDSKVVKQIATDIADDAMNYLLNGDELNISAEIIIQTLKDNEDKISKATGGYVLNEHDYEVIQKNLEDGGLKEISNEVIERDYGGYLSFARFILKITTLIIFVAAAVACLFLILLIGGKVFGNLNIAINCLITAGIGLVAAYIGSNYVEENYDIVTGLTDPAFTRMNVFSYCAAVAGGVFLLICIISAITGRKNK